MGATFAELYAPVLKEVFTVRAREDLAQGVDGLERARTYAEQGKPDFVLAYLLLIDVQEDTKREILAHSYERRAELSEKKAKFFQKQFHRAFPLIGLEVQKDRIAAQCVREGKSLRRDGGPRLLNMS